MILYVCVCVVFCLPLICVCMYGGEVDVRHLMVGDEVCSDGVTGVVFLPFRHTVAVESLQPCSHQVLVVHWFRVACHLCNPSLQVHILWLISNGIEFYNRYSHFLPIHFYFLTVMMNYFHHVGPTRIVNEILLSLCLILHACQYYISSSYIRLRLI